MKRVLTLLLMMFLTAGVAVADSTEPVAADAASKPLTVRTFQFKYRAAERAAAIIKPLVSVDGTMSIQPATNALVVTDRSDNIRSIAAALADFDVPPHAVHVSVHLIAASRQQAAGVVPLADLREISGKLGMLGYVPVEDLGQANIEAHEGEPGQVDLANGYRADFHFGDIDAATDSVKVTDFKVSRIQKDQLIQLYKASLNLRIGQPLIFGVTKTQGPRALFLVFVAHR